MYYMEKSFRANNVISFDAYRTNESDHGQEQLDQEADIVFIEKHMGGATDHERECQANYFLYRNKNTIDSLPRRAWDYFMDQLNVYEAGNAGEDVVVLQDALDEILEIVERGELDRLPDEFQGLMKSIDLSDLEAEERRKNFRVIDGGQSYHPAGTEEEQ